MAIPNAAELAEQEKKRLEEHILKVAEQKKIEEALDPGRPYEWSAAKNADGLLQEHPAYADEKCNDCYGRGVLLAVANKVREKYVGRNELCPCDSGKKFKKCHGAATGDYTKKDRQRRKVVCGCVIRGYIKLLRTHRSMANQKLVELLAGAPKDVPMTEGEKVVGHRVSDELQKQLVEQASASAAKEINALIGA